MTLRGRRCGNRWQAGARGVDAQSIPAKALIGASSDDGPSPVGILEPNTRGPVIEGEHT
jgi:hypothetical protein